jgi:phosphoserine phosphatase
VTGTIIDKTFMTASFMEISRTLDVDISFKKTICTEETDAWCVLIWIRPYSNRIDELAELAGVGEQAKPLQKQR